MRTVIIATLGVLPLSLFVHGSVFSSENVIKSNKAYGITKRIKLLSDTIIILPIGGLFNTNDNVDIFNRDGDCISKGKVKSVYSDEVFINITDGEIGNIKKGSIASKGYTRYEIELIDEGEIDRNLAVIADLEEKAQKAYEEEKKLEEERWHETDGGPIVKPGTKKPPVYWKHNMRKGLLSKDDFHGYCKGCHQKEKKGPVKCDGCHRK
jgi:hypothetical protein